MLFIHEIHSLAPSVADDYEAALRDRWTPAVAEDGDIRLVWCARTLPSPVAGLELVTLTAVADGTALERFGARTRSGDLRAEEARLASVRSGITRRIVAPLRFSRYEPDLGSAAPVATGPTDAVYIHDFVRPRIGMQRPYEDAMGQAFMKALDVEYSDFVMWGGFETVSGGGPMPESLMITLVQNPAAGTRLLSEGNPREAIKPGTWLFDALKLRDTWTSRLLRPVEWSPTT